jgi:hypothetical protein
MKKIAKNKRIVDSGESKAVTWIRQFARQIGKVPLRNLQK